MAKIVRLAVRIVGFFLVAYPFLSLILGLPDLSDVQFFVEQILTEKETGYYKVVPAEDYSPYDFYAVCLGATLIGLSYLRPKKPIEQNINN